MQGLGFKGLGLRVEGCPQIKGTIVGGPNDKDYSILRSILGSPFFLEATI